MAFDYEIASSETVMIAVLVVFASVGLVAWVNAKKAKYRLPPYAPAGPLQTVRAITSNEGPWFLVRMAKEAGFVLRLQLPFAFGTPVVAVGDANVARQILMDPSSTKPPVLYPSTEAFGRTFFNSEGMRWKHVRKGVTPSFSSNHVRRMNSICMDHMEDWIENVLEPKIDRGQPFDAPREFKLLTLSIILEAAFEYKCSNREEMEAFSTDLEIMHRNGFVARMNPVNRLLGSLHPAVRRYRKAAEKLFVFCAKVLQTFKENHTKGHSSGEPTVMLSIFSNPNYANDKERIADIFVLLVGGHDTTAFSLAWTLLELSKHPMEVEKIRKQLAHVPKEEWAKGSVLQNVIKEAMRLHPVASFGGARSPSKDIIYKPQGRGNKDDDEIVIPKGSICLLPQILLNYNPDHHDKADQFLPSRWENPSEIAKASFMPFSLGRRNCVGQSLATAELHSVLARLLSADYNFAVAEEGITEHFVTLKPTGFQCLVTRKQKA